MARIDIARAAEALIGARNTHRWLWSLPDEARPMSEAEAYAIQDLVARHLGPVVGWKVGSATQDSEPFRAPIHAATLLREAPHLPASMFHFIGVEAEIVFRFASDLTPRRSPYTRAEVMAAVDALHPAIEIVDSRFAVFGTVDPLGQRADQQNHGALIVGPAAKVCADVTPERQPFKLMIDGIVRCEGIGGNSAVDPIRLLVWLANRGAHSFGGLRSGQLVTTGSCTGTIFVAPGTSMRAEFPGLGSVDLEIS
jgi:2-keto-4-pentenoate hydratase